ARSQDPADFIRREQRWRAAAEEDCVNGRAGFRSRLDLANKGIDVEPLDCLIEQPAREIAVVANRRAERDVEIKTVHLVTSDRSPAHQITRSPDSARPPTAWSRRGRRPREGRPWRLRGAG